MVADAPGKEMNTDSRKLDPLHLSPTFSWSFFQNGNNSGRKYH